MKMLAAVCVLSLFGATSVCSADFAPKLIFYDPSGSSLLPAFRDAVHDTSSPLREMVPASAIPLQSPADQGVDTSARSTANLALQGLNSQSIVQSFDGIVTTLGSTSTWASDANADVGHDYVMEAVNFSAAIYTKTGSLVMGPFPTSSFWSGFSAPCGGTWSDVIVLYDQAADRWLVSRFARQNNTSPLNWYQCFAISQTSDPTGKYYRYAFLIDTEEFNDYPKFGIWPDGYYMTADRDKIFPGTGNFVGAFERAQMLQGLPAQAIVKKLDNNGNRAGMLPADWDGDTPPPAGSPGWFVKTIDDNTGWPADGLEIWQLAVDWTNGTGVLSLQTTLMPDAFHSAVCDLDQNCITQPDTMNGLDPLAGGRPMYRLAYRNFGGHEAMVFNHTVESVEDQAAVRWYELRKDGGNPWSIFQQQTLSPDDDHRWIGSMAMDRFGDAALVYNVSGETVYPSIRLASRQPGDPLDTMDEQMTLMAGSGSQTGFVFWADYSSLTLDPDDDCTFWSAATYQPTTTVNQGWATRISAFRFPDCTADLAIAKAAAPAGAIVAGTDVTWDLDVTDNGPAGAGNVSVADDVPAGTAFVSISAADWACTTPSPGGSGAIDCDRDSLGASVSSAIEVVANVDCSIPDGTPIMNTATVDADTPDDPDLTNNEASATFTVDNPVPIVTASVEVSQLKPGNHNLVDVGLEATATDGPCLEPPLVVTVYSDEDDVVPGSGGRFSPDAADVAPGTLRLRAERMGTSNGRVYLIVVSATDDAGGTGFATLTVTVPKSAAKAWVQAVDSEAAVAKAYADANAGAPPPGYVPVGDGPVIGPKQ
jgi:uncharacterized repeat protein (TIGR01451 family)